MKTLCWVYQDRLTNDLVLVRKPHRRAFPPRYYVEAGIFRRNGFRPDSFLGTSARWYDSTEFRERFQYVGGLNTGIKRWSKALTYFHVI